MSKGRLIRVYNRVSRDWEPQPRPYDTRWGKNEIAPGVQRAPLTYYDSAPPDPLGPIDEAER